jgi:hypothetical protein
LDPKTGKVVRTVPVAAKDLCVDLASDGENLYLVPYGWSMGQAILQYNLAKGQWGPEIVTEANKANKVYSTRGIAWRGGALYIGSHLGIQKVDPKSGEAAPAVTARLDGYRIFGVGALDFDGDTLVASGTIEKVKNGPDGKPIDNSYGLDKERPRLSVILRIDAATGAVKSFEPLNYPVNTLAFAGGVYWLSEQPESGFDRQNKPVRLHPRKMVIHRLELTAK